MQHTNTPRIYFVLIKFGYDFHTAPEPLRSLSCGTISHNIPGVFAPTPLHTPRSCAGSHGVQGHTDLPAAQAVDSAFHVYAVDWTPDQIKLSVDGAVYATRTPQDLPAGKSWAYNHPFFIPLNFAVGGKWPGNPDDTTRFPQQVLVDYVRVYHL